MLFSVKTAFNLKTTAEDLFPVLADYDLYSQWIPDIIDSRVLAREGDISVAEFFWPRLSAKKLVLEYVHNPPRSAIFSQIDQLRRRGLSGQWDIVDSRDSQGVILKYRMDFRTSLADIFSGNRLRRVLGAIPAAIAQRVSKPAAEQTPELDAGKKLILQVVRRPETIDVWYEGRLSTFPITAEPKRE